MEFHEVYMRAALMEAEKARKKGECPVGAVIVRNNAIIGRGHNLRERKQSVLMHAELEAIRKASHVRESWRLQDCDLYVTLEPCPMCAGAIIQSRIRRVYFGAYDKKAGAAGSVCDLFVPGLFNHTVDVTGGIMQEACAEILSKFFRQLRTKEQ